MPIQVVEITDKQLEDVLALTEGHFIDVKAKEIKPAKLTKAISAFVNANGGELSIGIRSEFRPPLGTSGRLSRTGGSERHIQVFETLFPLGDDYLYTFLSHPRQSGVVLQATVRKSRAVVRASDGVPYIRRGSQSLPVDTPAKLALLERNKGITSFENETVGIDLPVVCNSETVIRFILDVVPSSEPEAWLRKQELIKSNKPTVSAVLLFADLPQAALPKRSGIKIYRYKTGEAAGTRDTLVGNPISIEGCAYHLITEAVRTTREIINGIQVLGPRGLESVTYPTETLHEVITNAVLHRDYAIPDDDCPDLRQSCGSRKSGSPAGPHNGSKHTQ